MSNEQDGIGVWEFDAFVDDSSISPAPDLTVTVLPAGNPEGDPVSLYDDIEGTSKDNPFTASGGRIRFFADNDRRYLVKVEGDDLERSWDWQAVTAPRTAVDDDDDDDEDDIDLSQYDDALARGALIRFSRLDADGNRRTLIRPDLGVVFNFHAEYSSLDLTSWDTNNLQASEYDIESGELLARYSLYDTSQYLLFATGVDVSPDGRYVAVAGQMDDLIAVYDRQEKKSEAVLTITDPMTVAFSPSGDHLAYATGGSINLLDTTNWEDDGALISDEPDAVFHRIAFGDNDQSWIAGTNPGQDPNGNRIFVVSDGSDPVVIETNSEDLVYEFQRHATDNVWLAIARTDYSPGSISEDTVIYPAFEVDDTGEIVRTYPVPEEFEIGEEDSYYPGGAAFANGGEDVYCLQHYYDEDDGDRYYLLARPRSAPEEYKYARIPAMDRREPWDEWRLFMAPGNDMTTFAIADWGQQESVPTRVLTSGFLSYLTATQSPASRVGFDVSRPTFDGEELLDSFGVEAPEVEDHDGNENLTRFDLSAPVFLYGSDRLNRRRVQLKEHEQDELADWEDWSGALDIETEDKTPYLFHPDWGQSAARAKDYTEHGHESRWSGQYEFYPSSVGDAESAVYVAAGGSVHKVKPFDFEVLETYAGGEGDDSTAQINAMVPDRDGNLYIGRDDGNIAKVEMGGLTFDDVFQPDTSSVHSLEFGMDGYLYAGVAAGDDNPRRILKLSPSDGSEEGVYETGEDDARSLLFGGDGYLYGGADDSTGSEPLVYRIDPTDMVKVADYTISFSGRNVYALAWGRCGLLYAAVNDEVIAFQPRTMSNVREWEPTGDHVRGLSFARHGRLFAASSDPAADTSNLSVVKPGARGFGDPIHEVDLPTTAQGIAAGRSPHVFIALEADTGQRSPVLRAEALHTDQTEELEVDAADEDTDAAVVCMGKPWFDVLDWATGPAGVIDYDPE